MKVTTAKLRYILLDAFEAYCEDEPVTMTLEYDGQLIILKNNVLSVQDGRQYKVDYCLRTGRAFKLQFEPQTISDVIENIELIINDIKPQ